MYRIATEPDCSVNDNAFLVWRRSFTDTVPDTLWCRAPCRAAPQARVGLTVVSPTPGRLEGRASRPSAPAINRNDRSELEPTAYYPDITKARSEVGFAQLPETAYPSEIQAGQKGNHDNDQEEHIGGGRGMSVADE